VTDSHGPKVPRSSAQVMRSSIDDHNKRRKSKALRRTIFSVVVLFGLVYGANAFLVARPTAAALKADTAYAHVVLHARLHYYLDPTALVLDLRSNASADPEEAFRALVQVAGALQTAGRSFERVILAHGSDAVYVLTGADFAKLGTAVIAGRPPTVVARAVPMLLRGPTGSGGIGPWADTPKAPLGLIFTDAAGAAGRWASGGH
jgi:hypothetical protein